MPGADQKSLRPIATAARQGRTRLGLREELTLALFPTATILLVLWAVERLASQHVLFAALASSAFLIYLDPTHGANRIQAVVGAHITAATAGIFAAWMLGYGYGASGLAMVVTILAMVIADIVHPPAIGTSLSFAYRSGTASNFSLFLLALGMVVLLVLLQRLTQYLLTRFTANANP